MSGVSKEGSVNLSKDSQSTHMSAAVPPLTGANPRAHGSDCKDQSLEEKPRSASTAQGTSSTEIKGSQFIKCVLFRFQLCSFFVSTRHIRQRLTFRIESRADFDARLKASRLSCGLRDFWGDLALSFGDLVSGRSQCLVVCSTAGGPHRVKYLRQQLPFLMKCFGACPGLKVLSSSELELKLVHMYMRGLHCKEG